MISKLRRTMMQGGLACLGLSTAPFAWAGSGHLTPTPAQTTGPFYPDAFPEDVDRDLAQVGSGSQPAQGQVTFIIGRVLDTNANPLTGARIEIWQCDALGRYIHSADADRGPADPAFQGYGRTITAFDGLYWFRTIRPVPYTGRTPHIHFAVSPRDGQGLVTQMYVANEKANARDVLYRRLRSESARDALTVALEPAPEIEEGALAGRFDIVLA